MAQSNKENRAQDRRPLEVFCSYAQNKQDEALLQELEQHLAPHQNARRLIQRKVAPARTKGGGELASSLLAM